MEWQMWKGVSSPHWRRSGCSTLDDGRVCWVIGALVHGNWANSNNPMGCGWAEAGSSECRGSWGGVTVGWQLGAFSVCNQRATARRSLGLGGEGEVAGGRLTLGMHPGQSAFGCPTLHGWQNAQVELGKAKQSKMNQEVPASCDVPPAPSTDKPNIVLTVKEKCFCYHRAGIEG